MERRLSSISHLQTDCLSPLFEGPPMLSVLMIDDDLEMIETVRFQLELDMPDQISFASCQQFEEGKILVRNSQPDMLIVDWFEGEHESKVPEANGKKVWDQLWDNCFCPIVFFTAFESEVRNETAIDLNHPLVHAISKGPQGLSELTGKLKEFAPHAKALRSVSDDLQRSRQETIRAVASAIFSSNYDAVIKADILRRAVRRRIAASIDVTSAHGSENLYSWEQFLFPPISDHLMTGDLIRKASEPPDSPTSYRLVLTPTCDLVRHGGRCAVEAVLVAKCDDPVKFTHKVFRQPTDTNNKAAAEEQLKKDLAPALNDPHRAGLIVLPRCPTLSPLMVANLKRTELLPIEKIGELGSTSEYLRVASIDSPFREYFITWSFLQISCRPGVPPRTSEDVIEELMTARSAAMSPKSQKKKSQ